jgi:hypothetical protein
VTALYLYDDETAREFEPFSLTRPVSELMAECGDHSRARGSAYRARKPWFHQLSSSRSFRRSRRAEGSCVGWDHSAGSLIANSRFIPAIATNLQATAGEMQDAAAFHCGDEICAVRTKAERKSG